MVDLLPSSFHRYYEPFLGAGSLFFLIAPKHATLGDRCRPLISTYESVRDDSQLVLQHLKPLKPSPEQYYQIRQSKPRSRPKSAAHFIYLNKTCWNGLYRVNSRGEFNVPYGRPKTDNLIDAANLTACAERLQEPDVALVKGDFAESLADARKGDLVYLDPPYVTGHSNNGFRDYNETLFSWEDQERLAGIARSLAAKGVHVIVSNAHHDSILRLYRGFRALPLTRKSTLASDVLKRGTAKEVVLYR